RQRSPLSGKEEHRDAGREGHDGEQEDRHSAGAPARASTAPVAAAATSRAARAISSRSTDGPAIPRRSRSTAWVIRTRATARRIPSGPWTSGAADSARRLVPAAVVRAIPVSTDASVPPPLRTVPAPPIDSRPTASPIPATAPAVASSASAGQPSDEDWREPAPIPER